MSSGRPEGPADLFFISYLLVDLVHGAGHLDVVPGDRMVSIEGAQPYIDTIPDVRPIGVMRPALGQFGAACHESERTLEVTEGEAAGDLGALDLTVGSVDGNARKYPSGEARYGELVLVEFG